MAATLLDLPCELRWNIFHYVFSPRIALVEAGIQGQVSSLIPAKATIRPLAPCSGQVLRVCKQVRQEAEPMLYSRTHFLTLTQAFAGVLPTIFADGMPFASKVKHLTWQLNCDLMKNFYSEDFVISSRELAQLDSLELRAQAENWKASFCGAWVDREVFVQGRAQLIEYAQRLQSLMNEGCSRKVFVVEDRSGLSRGRVTVRLSRKKSVLGEGEVLVN